MTTWLSIGRVFSVGLVALVLGFSGVAFGQTFSSGWLCNKTDATVHYTWTSHSNCRENVNGTMVDAYCTNHFGWIDIAPGGCSGITGVPVLFASEGYGVAYSDDGTNWLGNGADGFLGFVCVDSTRTSFYRSSALYFPSAGSSQFIRYNCNENEWRNGFPLPLRVGGNRWGDLLPGGAISYR